MYMYICCYLVHNKLDYQKEKVRSSIENSIIYLYIVSHIFCSFMHVCSAVIALFYISPKQHHELMRKCYLYIIKLSCI